MCSIWVLSSRRAHLDLSPTFTSLLICLVSHNACLLACLSHPVACLVICLLFLVIYSNRDLSGLLLDFLFLVSLSMQWMPSSELILLCKIVCGCIHYSFLSYPIIYQATNSSISLMIMIKVWCGLVFLCWAEMRRISLKSSNEQNLHSMKL